MEHTQPSYQFAANEIQISDPLCLISHSSNPTQRSNHQLTMLVQSRKPKYKNLLMHTMRSRETEWLI